MAYWRKMGQATSNDPLCNVKDPNCHETYVSSSSGGQLVECAASTQTYNDPIVKVTSSRARQQVETAAATPTQNDPSEEAIRSSDLQQVEPTAATPTQNDPNKKASSSSGVQQVESAARTPTHYTPFERETTSSSGQLVESAAPTQKFPTEKEPRPDGKQQVEPAAARSTQNGPTEKADVNNSKIKVELEHDADMRKRKIHRYPATIRALSARYTVPTIVAIGPYHHGRDHKLIETEDMKHEAAHHWTSESDQKMYDAVVSAAAYARSLYDKNAVEGISDYDFQSMMFNDACFLVQYMLWKTDGHRHMVEPSLSRFFRSKDNDLQHDVCLLENQLPWRMTETVMSMRFRSMPLADFIAPWKAYLQDPPLHDKKHFVLDSGYKPPHLLGLLRFYIVGKRRNSKKPSPGPATTSSSDPFSVMKLSEVGITLTADKTTTELIHMGVKKKGILCAELSLVPLTLDDARASFLFNMATLELCMTSDFQQAAEEDSVVCSYLRLLAMLMHRVEDVHELRTIHNLLRGAGLADTDMFLFFTRLRKLPEGSSYTRIMEEIADYKVKR